MVSRLLVRPELLPNDVHQRSRLYVLAGEQRDDFGAAELGRFRILWWRKLRRRIRRRRRRRFLVKFVSTGYCPSASLFRTRWKICDHHWQTMSRSAILHLV